jgi:hypothetical protein
MVSPYFSGLPERVFASNGRRQTLFRCRILAALAAAVLLAPVPGAAQEPVPGSDLAEPVCSTENSEAPRPIARLERPMHLLVDGSYVETGGFSLLLGTEQDATGSPVGAVDEAAQWPLAIHSERGRLALPASQSRAPVGSPLPVLTSDGGWGLLWVEPRPDDEEGPWPGWDDFPHRLYFARAVDEGWGPANTVLSVDLRIHWEADRTVTYSESRGTLMMLKAEHTLGVRDVLFGSAEGGLRPLPLNPPGVPPLALEVRPLLGTFILLPDGRALAAIVASRHIGRESTREILLLEEESAGGGWSPLTAIWELSSRAGAKLDLHRDRAGFLHILLERGLTGEMLHLVSEDGGRSWAEQPVPSHGGANLGWVTGIDRCGRLAMVRSVMVAINRMEVQLGRWAPEGWSAFATVVDGDHGFYPFSGRGADGTWHVGWSGLPQLEPIATIYLFTP